MSSNKKGLSAFVFTNDREFRGREEWFELVGQYRRSGLTQKQFCEENSLRYGSFKNWVYLDNKRSRKQETKGKFIPVQSVTPASLLSTPAEIAPAPEHSSSSFSSDFRIHLSQGSIIIVPRGFDEDTLLRVVKVMGCHV